MNCKETHLSQKMGECYADENGANHIKGYGALFFDGTEATEYNQMGALITRFMPGAFDGTDFFAGDIHAYFNHDPNQVLGRTSAGTLRLHVDAIGLFYDVTLPDTQLGRDLSVSVGRGDIRGASVTILVGKEGESRKKTGSTYIRELTKVELLEVGPVTRPAFSNTSASMFSIDILNEIKGAELAASLENERQKRARDLALKEKCLTS